MKKKTHPLISHPNISGEADLLEAIQLVIQKYRSKSIPSPSFVQSVPLKPAVKPQPLQLIAVESGESDLLQSIQRIQQQISIPIFSGEADLVTFIEQIKRQNPDLSSSQLSAIISGEAISILQILNQKSQQTQYNGIPILSGSTDLFEAIEFVIQKYRNQSQVYPLPLKNTIPYPQTVPLQSQAKVCFKINLSLSLDHLYSKSNIFVYILGYSIVTAESKCKWFSNISAWSIECN